MRKRIKEKIKEGKRQVILKEVSEMFQEEGFYNLKMQDIAKRVGVSVGAIYKLFESKDELFYAYVSFEIEDFYQKLITIAPLETTEPILCLQTYIRLKFDTLFAKRKAIEDPIIGDPLFFMKMNTKKHNPALPIFDYLSSCFESIKNNMSLKENNHRKLAYLFNAFTNGYIAYWIHYQDKIEESQEEVLEQFLQGVSI